MILTWPTEKLALTWWRCDRQCNVMLGALQRMVGAFSTSHLAWQICLSATRPGTWLWKILSEDSCCRAKPAGKPSWLQGEILINFMAFRIWDRELMQLLLKRVYIYYVHIYIYMWSYIYLSTLYLGFHRASFIRLFPATFQWKKDLAVLERPILGMDLTCPFLKH